MNTLNFIKTLSFWPLIYEFSSTFPDKSYHHSFGNHNNNENEEYSDESFDVSTHDIEGFKEGPFGNANSNFVKSEIEQNIQHSSSIEPE